ncbi:hypothetical protein ACWCQ0_50215, partial [Streptomyces massasporeus]
MIASRMPTVKRLRAGPSLALSKMYVQPKYSFSHLLRPSRYGTRKIAPQPAPAPHLRLPPTDRVLSPRTGWTRAHWEALADRQLEALVPYATPGFAQYRLPGRTSWSGVVSDGL